MAKQLARETTRDTDLLQKEQQLSKGAKPPQEVKRRWRTELLALFVSDWKPLCDEKRCAHSQEMFEGKVRSSPMEIIIKVVKRSIRGTRNRTESIQINPVVVKHEQIKLRNGSHTRTGVIKEIMPEKRNQVQLATTAEDVSSKSDPEESVTSPLHLQL